MFRRFCLVGLAAVLLVAFALLSFAVSAQAAACSDYATQAEAQRAGNTRDGRLCESLRCPCAGASDGGGGGGSSSGGGSSPSSGSACARPERVVRLVFNARRYPHVRSAISAGWPRVMRVNRRGADARRDRLLADSETRDGFDRDEYPAAVGRGRGPGLERGRDPRGWRASVRYVPSSENRSHGASLGAKLERYCNGTAFRYVFR